MLLLHYATTFKLWNQRPPSSKYGINSTFMQSQFNLVLANYKHLRMKNRIRDQSEQLFCKINEWSKQMDWQNSMNQTNSSLKHVRRRLHWRSLSFQRVYLFTKLISCLRIRRKMNKLIEKTKQWALSKVHVPSHFATVFLIGANEDWKNLWRNWRNCFEFSIEIGNHSALLLFKCSHLTHIVSGISTAVIPIGRFYSQSGERKKPIPIQCTNQTE